MTDVKNTVGKVVDALLVNGARSAVAYISPKFRVKATRRTFNGKLPKEINIALSLGRPNYLERKFVKTAVTAKEPFPIKKVQLKYLKAA